LKEAVHEKELEMKLKELDEKIGKMSGTGSAAAAVPGQSTQRCIEMAQEWLRQRGVDV
jgi:hypothetical protein